MPRSIVTIAVGGAGVAASRQFLTLLAADIGGTQPSSHEAFFHKRPSGVLTPSAVFVDTDPIAGARARAQLLNQGLPFRVQPDFIVTAKESAARCYSRAYRDVIDTRAAVVLDRVRKLRDQNTVDAFMIVHSLAGGTGSGLGIKLAELLRSHYPKTACVSVALLPSATVDPSPLDTLNAGLALHKLASVCDLCLLADNDALSHYARQDRDSARNLVLGRAVANFALMLQEQRTSISAVMNHLRAVNALPFTLMARVTGGSPAKEQLTRALAGDGALVNASAAVWARAPQSAVLLWRGAYTIKERSHAEALLNARAIKPSPSALSVHIPRADGKTRRALYAFMTHAGLGRLLAKKIQEPFARMVSAHALTHGYIRDGLTNSVFNKASSGLASVVSTVDKLRKR